MLRNMRATPGKVGGRHVGPGAPNLLRRTCRAGRSPGRGLHGPRLAGGRIAFASSPPSGGEPRAGGEGFRDPSGESAALDSGTRLRPVLARPVGMNQLFAEDGDLAG